MGALGGNKAVTIPASRLIFSLPRIFRERFCTGELGNTALVTCVARVSITRNKPIRSSCLAITVTGVHMAIDNPRGANCTERTHTVRTLDKAKEWLNSVEAKDLPITIHQTYANTRLHRLIVNKHGDVMGTVG